jgi:hypothetical protein
MHTQNRMDVQWIVSRARAGEGITMGGWLIYHPKRQRSCFGDIVVYHDSFAGNQDPYVWNHRFLHTCCHMTQMSPQISDINLWVSGESLRDFSHLWCDLVFVVGEKVYWRESNRIDLDDPLVESPAALLDHYEPCHREHPYKRKRRFTLKADPQRSFQPQTAKGELIDILPALRAESGLSVAELRTKLRAGFNSRPMRLEDSIAGGLYQYLRDTASIHLKGAQLEELRTQIPGNGNRGSS